MGPDLRRPRENFLDRLLGVFTMCHRHVIERARRATALVTARMRSHPLAAQIHLDYGGAGADLDCFADEAVRHRVIVMTRAHVVIERDLGVRLVAMGKALRRRRRFQFIVTQRIDNSPRRDAGDLRAPRYLMHRACADRQAASVLNFRTGPTADHVDRFR